MDFVSDSLAISVVSLLVSVANLDPLFVGFCEKNKCRNMAALDIFLVVDVPLMIDELLSVDGDAGALAKMVFDSLMPGTRLSVTFVAG